MKNRTVSISLAIAFALSMCLTGCGGEEIPEYSLAISSGEGGKVTTPGEGVFVCDEGMVLDLVAEADEGYHFLNWTGDVDTIADVSAASTAVIMNGDYSVTASFEEDEVVTFIDPSLEAAIREAIGKPTGPVYPSDLEGLTSVMAPRRNIADLTGLERCTSLTYLNLLNNQIGNISPLAGLTRLTTVLLGLNQISDMSLLANLINLETLYLEHNQIDDISPLASLTNLRYVSLWGNQVSDLFPLGNLTSLTGVFLGYNQISDISSLTNLINLAQLNLEDNRISNISPPANLTSLTYLYLGQNQITDISPLANLTSLETVVLMQNQVSDISSVASLVNLHRINLYSNQISDISPLVQNEGLDMGDIVNLDNNPLSSESINIYIPQLEARGVLVEY